MTSLSWPCCMLFGTEIRVLKIAKLFEFMYNAVCPSKNVRVCVGGGCVRAYVCVWGGCFVFCNLTLCDMKCLSILQIVNEQGNLFKSFLTFRLVGRRILSFVRSHPFQYFQKNRSGKIDRQYPFVYILLSLWLKKKISKYQYLYVD